MYYSKDTVMRMIEQLGDVWRKLMDKLDDLEVQQQLDKAYRRFCGVDRLAAEQLDVPSLLVLLEDPQRMALAELTCLRAERNTQQLDDDTLSLLYLRALRLLTSIESEEIAIQRVCRAEALLRALGDALPAEDAAACLRFLALGGAFSQGEDLLFAQLEQWPAGSAPSILLEAGEAFYAELEECSDEALLAGNLPREELRQGRAELRRCIFPDGGQAT